MNPGNDVPWELPPEYHDEPAGPPCPVCGCEMGWERCHEVGCEDGYVDEYDDDPINTDPGDVTPCPECKGRGGYYVCPNVPHVLESPTTRLA